MDISCKDKTFTAGCCQELKLHIYVDDIYVNAVSINELLQLRCDLISALSSTVFELKKRSSNSQSILDIIPPEDHLRDPRQFSDDIGGLIKVLDLRWDSTEDIFGFKVQYTADIIHK